LKSAEMQHYNKVEYITYFTFVHLLYAELLFFKRVWHHTTTVAVSVEIVACL